MSPPKFTFHPQTITNLSGQLDVLHIFSPHKSNSPPLSYISRKKPEYATLLFPAVGRKRQLDQDGSPSPSIASVSKRFCESSRVPTTSNSVIVVRRKVDQKATSKLPQETPVYSNTASFFA